MPDHADQQLIRELAKEIQLMGGVVASSRLVTPAVRKLLRDRRLLTVLRGLPECFRLIDDDFNGGTCRVAIADGWDIASVCSDADVSKSGDDGEEVTPRMHNSILTTARPSSNPCRRPTFATAAVSAFGLVLCSSNISKGRTVPTTNAQP